MVINNPTQFFPHISIRVKEGVEIKTNVYVGERKM
jgi:hypothetical protein